MRLVGHAAVFNSRSTDLGDFYEVIAPGAFRRTLTDRHPIFAVHHHDYSALLGSTLSGALRLSEDKEGLRFELELPETSLGRDIHALVRRGDLAHMSFSFSVNGAAGESWRELSGGMYERTLHDIDLFEVSTVARPAYLAANVAARDAAQATSEVQSTRNRMTKRFMQARLLAA